MSSKNKNNTSNLPYEQSNQPKPNSYDIEDSSAGRFDVHTGSSEYVDSSNRKKESAAVPKIKIFSQQVYEPVRVDPKLRETLHREYGVDPLLLIFTPNSREKLKGYIGWGHQTSANRVEQGGILLGRVYRYKSEIFSFVEDCVLANTRGSSALVEFTPNMWSIMQQELDDLNVQKDKEKQMAIIGWFHTHPNGLSVFMSGTDQNTQDKNFSQDWQVSVVLNPHKMKLRAFFGKEIQDGRIVGWDDRPLRENPAPNPFPLNPLPDANSFDDPQREIKRLEGIVENLKKKITEYNGRISKLKSSAKKRSIIGLCLLALFFCLGLGIGNWTNSTINPTDTSETPTSQTSATTEPELKKTSLIMFSVAFEKWTSHNDTLRCNISVKGTTSEGLPYNRNHLITCNNDEAYIELEAGTYTITFSRLPTLTDGTVFKAITPITVAVDGANPKLIKIELETKMQEETTSAPTSEKDENELITNSQSAQTTSSQSESPTSSKPNTSD